MPKKKDTGELETTSNGRGVARRLYLGIIIRGYTSRQVAWPQYFNNNERFITKPQMMGGKQTQMTPNNVHGFRFMVINSHEESSRRGGGSIEMGQVVRSKK